MIKYCDTNMIITYQISLGILGLISWQKVILKANDCFHQSWKKKKKYNKIKKEQAGWIPVFHLFWQRQSTGFVLMNGKVKGGISNYIVSNNEKKNRKTKEDVT